MNTAHIARLLADVHTLITEGRPIDDTERRTLAERCQTAIFDLSSVSRIEVEIISTDLVDSHETPSGQPVTAKICGPHELGRALPGRAVLEIARPTRRTS